MTATESLRVVVGLSGGVDSAVAALRLCEQGHMVEGLFMKNWEEDDSEAYCAARQDLEDAQGVCERLGIRLHTVNFSAEYWDRVFQHFLDEYRRGRTPNPDVTCNTEIKFRAFLEHARSLGADYIATGHYADRDQADQRWRLLRSADENKDQTYFLHALNQSQLAASLFPLARMDKPAVRKLAAFAGFANHAKKDSTGICFIGERKFSDFLARYVPAQPGEIRTPDGRPLGEHSGLIHYTAGQRQGLGVGGDAHGSGEPWYVVDKDLQTNVLTVVQGHDHPLLYSSGLTACQLSWIAEATPPWPLKCRARIRHRQPLQDCVVEPVDTNGVNVRFAQAQWAVAPGQAVVFYQGRECLGGGTIQTRHR